MIANPLSPYTTYLYIGGGGATGINSSKLVKTQMEVTIRPAAGRILTKPGMMTFLVCFMRRLRVICLLTKVS